MQYKWTSLACRSWREKGHKYLLRPNQLLGRIRSVPGNNTAPLIISPMMHPTDHMSTENKNEMKVNKKTETEQQINEKTSPILPPQRRACSPPASCPPRRVPAPARALRGSAAGLRKIDSTSFRYPSVDARQWELNAENQMRPAAGYCVKRTVIIKIHQLIVFFKFSFAFIT